MPAGFANTITPKNSIAEAIREKNLDNWESEVNFVLHYLNQLPKISHPMVCQPLGFLFAIF
jgi:hypothetical protein